MPKQALLKKLEILEIDIDAVEEALLNVRHTFEEIREEIEAEDDE